MEESSTTPKIRVTKVFSFRSMEVGSRGAKTSCNACVTSLRYRSFDGQVVSFYTSKGRTNTIRQLCVELPLARRHRSNRFETSTNRACLVLDGDESVRLPDTVKTDAC